MTGYDRKMMECVHNAGVGCSLVGFFYVHRGYFYVGLPRV